MKKHGLVYLILCGLLAFAGPVWSLTISSGTIDVGSQDPLLYSATVNSGDQNEINWVNNMLGTSFTVTDMIKYDSNPADWKPVDANPGIWALNLKDTPEYILIKIGTGSLPLGTPDHYLFDNLVEFQWAVIAFSDLNITALDVTRISHIDEIAVPEPGILILLGLSMMAIGVAARFVRKI